MVLKDDLAPEFRYSGVGRGVGAENDIPPKKRRSRVTDIRKTLETIETLTLTISLVTCYVVVGR